VTRKRTVCRQRKDTVTVKVELECNRDECQPECPGQSNRRVSGPGRAANGSLSVSDNDLESKPERHWHWQAQAPGPASLSDSEGPRFRMPQCMEPAGWSGRWTTSAAHGEFKF
jgi:hypothetical protein